MKFYSSKSQIANAAVLSVSAVHEEMSHDNWAYQFILFYKTTHAHLCQPLQISSYQKWHCCGKILFECETA